MRHQHPELKPLFERWQDWLEFPVDQLFDHMLAPEMWAREMRQVSPFAGVLSSSERTRVLREFQWEERRRARGQ